MKEVQPICIIYLPTDFSFIKPFDLMNELNGWEPNITKEPLGGYVWFSFYKDTLTEPEFKVFYPKDFDEIEFEELKKIVMGSINKQ